MVASRFLIIVLSCFAFVIFFYWYGQIPVVSDMAIAFGYPLNCGKNLLNAFFIGMFLGTIFAGKLANLFSCRTMILSSNVILIFATLLTLISVNFRLVEFSILLQGCSCGLFFPLLFSMASYFYQGQQLKNVISLITAITVMTPMVAPLAGGFTLAHATWRHFFVVLLCLSIIILILGFYAIPSFARLQNRSGSIFRDLKKLYSNPIYSGVLFINMILTGGLTAFIVELPFIAIGHFQYSPAQIGIYFSIGASANFLGVLVFHKFSKTISWIKLLLISILLIDSSWLLLVLFMFGEQNNIALMTSLLIIFMLGYGIGLPLAFYCITLTLRGTGLENVGSSIFNAARWLGCCIFSILATYMTLKNLTSLFILFTPVVLISSFSFIYYKDKFILSKS